MPISVVALSDSHATCILDLPAALRDALQRADIIVHAGDHTEYSLLQDLQRISPRLIAVAGNMDSTAIKLRLPHRQHVTLDGTTVGVTHGSGSPIGIEQRVRLLFPENPDLIIFGHSHMPFNSIVEGTLMVNPGPAKNGYATIAVGDTLDAEIVTLQ